MPVDWLVSSRFAKRSVEPLCDVQQPSPSMLSRLLRKPSRESLVVADAMDTMCYGERSVSDGKSGDGSGRGRSASEPHIATKLSWHDPVVSGRRHTDFTEREDRLALFYTRAEYSLFRGNRQKLVDLCAAQSASGSPPELWVVPQGESSSGLAVDVDCRAQHIVDATHQIRDAQYLIDGEQLANLAAALSADLARNAHAVALAARRDVELQSADDDEHVYAPYEASPRLRRPPRVTPPDEGIEGDVIIDADDDDYDAPVQRAVEDDDEDESSRKGLVRMIKNDSFGALAGAATRPANDAGLSRMIKKDSFGAVRTSLVQLQLLGESLFGENMLGSSPQPPLPPADAPEADAPDAPADAPEAPKARSEAPLEKGRPPSLTKDHLTTVGLRRASMESPRDVTLPLERIMLLPAPPPPLPPPPASHSV
ncbi:hypothetical protein M885DRAFT_511512 [Pelagophyceae sp. CCMP2097]|nr:hypothetical protein M885DRAFT_511512 [Pelagophyceae sp. CCMP2097]|mmetsp:Transcript_19240/g.66339  ORF Transcript_19240/g.66339 Transcript_19240/m.66339 type:complete len:425 (-) Transcript_19240:199-1473(-)